MTIDLPYVLETYRIEVTSEDIERGVPDNCHHCPIALAARRAGLNTPEVDSAFLNGMVLPDAATEFILDYDNGEPVEPFSFEVSP